MTQVTVKVTSTNTNVRILSPTVDGMPYKVLIREGSAAVANQSAIDAQLAAAQTQEILEQVQELESRTVKSRWHKWESPYSYCATAPANATTDQPVWRIARIEMLDAGGTELKIAENVAVDDYDTITYN